MAPESPTWDELRPGVRRIPERAVDGQLGGGRERAADARRERVGAALQLRRALPEPSCRRALPGSGPSCGFWIGAVGSRGS